MLLLVIAALASASCTRSNVAHLAADPELAIIDSLMWTQPDSAFAQLQSFAESHDVDSLNDFNGHYFHLLLSELLYKNYCEQSNRNELLRAVDYYDSLLAEGGSHADADMVFLDARSHYIYGVGYYEMDSAVPACCEYLRAVELMEERFSEKELTGKRAQFMALAYTHLCGLFSDQYLHEQTIEFGKHALFFYDRFEAKPWKVSWVLSKLGSQYNILEQMDSSYYYYRKAQEQINDTASLIYRDTETLISMLLYRMGEDPVVVTEKLQHIVSCSVNEKEYLSRCAVIGEFYYSEKQYDSALVYLKEVFCGTASSTASKRQAAEWLVDICKNQGKEDEVLDYAGFLVPFANQEDNQSEIKSQLTFQYSKYVEQKQERYNSLKINRGMKLTIMFVGVILAITIALFLLHQKTNKTKRQLEKQLSDERIANETEQNLLKGQLEQFQKTQVDRFCEEPICKYILEVCNNPINTFKSTLPASAYSNIALDNMQKAQLEEAALCHYGPLIARLRTDYPQLKNKDYTYCYLCLLGLEDVQIAALTQRSYRTVWERGERLKKLFNLEEPIQRFLLDLIKY